MSGTGSAEGSGLGEFLRNPAFLGVALANGLMKPGRDSDHHLLPPLRAGDPRLRLYGMGYYYALLHALGTVSQPVLGYLSDRLGRKAVLLPAFLMLAVLYTLIRWCAQGFRWGSW